MHQLTWRPVVAPLPEPHIASLRFVKTQNSQRERQLGPAPTPELFWAILALVRSKLDGKHNASTDPVGPASGDTGRQHGSGEHFVSFLHPNEARLCSSTDKNRQCERQLPRAQTARVPLTYFQLAQVCRNSEQLACRYGFWKPKNATKACNKAQTCCWYGRRLVAGIQNSPLLRSSPQQAWQLHLRRAPPCRRRRR